MSEVLTTPSTYSGRARAFTSGEPIVKPAPGRLAMVLGPTNTGKTHLAVERMLGHSSGIIGLPLRLLAREIYDRIIAVRGPRAVALVTGEEKITPANPSYWVCTVEAMPMTRDVAFVAVDEIQLCADLERGHVFTDRLLRARGREETLFLGAQTLAPVLRRLLPAAEYITRPRFSKLIYAGAAKLSRLPRRSAVVAFSAGDVYAVAEMLRRQKGGAAVVMGALSPRTRNAQVAMYQNGDVDYLVATDAIGMGLNMDIDHVAFAAVEKFDGHRRRPLSPAELAQIAGRAGRYLNDGSFGLLADGRAGHELAPDIIAQIEDHRFAPVTRLQWRNGLLDFSSPAALLRSLEKPAPLRVLARAPAAEDSLVLKALAGEPDIIDLAGGPAATARLWEVCRIPDFRKTLADVHARLVGHIFRLLMRGDGRLPDDWLARQIARLERADGDIDTLASRIAHIRTWTYVANRPDWVDDPTHWRGRTRAAEDALSDALHARLTQRFVDRRSAVLMRRLAHRTALFAGVSANGEVTVEGEHVGHIDGLVFSPARTGSGAADRTVLQAATKALRGELRARMRCLLDTPDTALSLHIDRRSGHATVIWDGGVLADVIAGHDVLRPRLRLHRNDLLAVAAAERLHRHLEAWLARHIATRLAPLARIREQLATRPSDDGDAPVLSGPARGILYQMVENLGAVSRGQVRAQLRALTPADRRHLRALGVRFGEIGLYLPTLLKPPASRLCQVLWLAANGGDGSTRLIPTRPAVRRLAGGLDRSLVRAAGFVVVGDLAIRRDRIERLAHAARRLANNGPLTITEALAGRGGGTLAQTRAMLRHLGYRARQSDGVELFERPTASAGRPRRKTRQRGKGQRQDSPFAELGALTRGRGATRS